MILRSSSCDFVLSSSSLQAGQGVEPAHAHVEDRLDPLLAQAVHNIGGDAGIDGRVDHRRIGLVDEHGDRPGHRPAHLEHLLQHIAARAFEVDQDHIGIDRHDAFQQPVRLVQVHDLGIAGLAQPLLEHGPPHGALVDNHDPGCAVRGTSHAVLEKGSGVV